MKSPIAQNIHSETPQEVKEKAINYSDKLVMENKIELIKSVINKLPHSTSRVPYTYHHDYLREKSKKFMGLSRSEVAELNTSSERNLYIVCLAKIVEDSKLLVALNLTQEELEICLDCTMLAEAYINSIDIEL